MTDVTHSTSIDPETLGRLRRQLIAERDRVLEVEGVSVDELDDSDRWSDVVARALEELSDRTLSEVADALLRMESGAYGACEKCDSVIPVERLEAMPATRHCVSCQRAAE